MSLTKLAALLLVCLLTVESNVFVMAGDTHYTCVIASAATLTAQGALDAHWTVTPFIGQQFTVDRETGRILGGPLENIKFKIQLIDKGSQEMAFQMFALSKQMSHTIYIKIEEFRATEDKPFVGTTTLYYPGVYSGMCK